MTDEEFWCKYNDWTAQGVDMWTSLPELPPFLTENPLVVNGYKFDATIRESAMCVLIGEKRWYIGSYVQIGNSNTMWWDYSRSMIQDKILKWIPIPNQKQEEKS